MAVYIVACEFKKEIPDIKELSDLLHSIGPAISVSKTNWLVKSDKPPQEITGLISKHCRNTSAFVIEVKKNFSNFTIRVIEPWLDEHF